MAGGSASGDLISARNSKNKEEYIGCGQRVFEDGAGGVFYWGFCQANVESDTDEGVDAQCFTTNGALLEALSSLADSSYMVFDWETDSEGDMTCTMIGNSVNSFYLEKGKANNPAKE